MLTGKPRLGGEKALALPKPHTQSEVGPVPVGREQTPLPSVSEAGSCSPLPPESVEPQAGLGMLRPPLPAKMVTGRPAGTRLGAWGAQGIEVRTVGWLLKSLKVTICNWLG